MDASAVLLAGGKSARMGRGKAALVMDGLSLWRRQTGVLRATGAAEVFVSGRPGTFGEIETLPDDAPDQSPLTGLIVALRRARFPLLLVLAVDLPVMTPGYLQKLMARARPGVGSIPRRGEFFEPLAAVYPREALAPAEQGRRDGELSLQFLARRLVASQLVLPCDISTDEARLLTNVNSPENWALQGRSEFPQKSC